MSLISTGSISLGSTFKFDRYLSFPPTSAIFFIQALLVLSLHSIWGYFLIISTLLKMLMSDPRHHLGILGFYWLKPSWPGIFLEYMDFLESSNPDLGTPHGRSIPGQEDFNPWHPRIPAGDGDHTVTFLTVYPLIFIPAYPSLFCILSIPSPLLLCTYSSHPLFILYPVHSIPFAYFIYSPKRIFLYFVNGSVFREGYSLKKHFKGTQAWEFLGLRFSILYFLIVSYAYILRLCKKFLRLGHYWGK